MSAEQMADAAARRLLERCGIDPADVDPDLADVRDHHDDPAGGGDGG